MSACAPPDSLLYGAGDPSLNNSSDIAWESLREHHLAFSNRLDDDQKDFMKLVLNAVRTKLAKEKETDAFTEFTVKILFRSTVSLAYAINQNCPF